jgi:hypothetical protein
MDPQEAVWYLEESWTLALPIAHHASTSLWSLSYQNSMNLIVLILTLSNFVPDDFILRKCLDLSRALLVCSFAFEVFALLGARSDNEAQLSVSTDEVHGLFFNINHLQRTGQVLDFIGFQLPNTLFNN